MIILIIQCGTKMDYTMCKDEYVNSIDKSYKNSTYEYEYFDYEDKIILKEVENKKYKR